jgi:hypothetical protein
MHRPLDDAARAPARMTRGRPPGQEPSHGNGFRHWPAPLDASIASTRHRHRVGVSQYYDRPELVDNLSSISVVAAGTARMSTSRSNNSTTPVGTLSGRRLPPFGRRASHTTGGRT